MSYRNPEARTWRTDRPQGVRAVHEGVPGYAPTRLVSLPRVAAELGVASVHVKEESSRFGLPAFKMLGASYAILRALAERAGLRGVASVEEVRRSLGTGVPTPVLVAATDGNHGRAVARVAAMLGVGAEVFVPAGITRAAIDAIAGEGAHVTEFALLYDDVVDAAAAHATSSGGLLVQDTAWEGYEQIPAWIVDGYSTLFEEADEQLAEAGVVPDLVVVPVGVGSLAQAAVRHYRSGAGAPGILAVEPEAAPAILASLEAREVTSVPTRNTVMAGLNCGTPSFGAWPTLSSGLDAARTVTDAEAIRAVHDLTALGVDAGPCGAAALAGLRAHHAERPLDPSTDVLLISTEGRAANPLPGS